MTSFDKDVMILKKKICHLNEKYQMTDLNPDSFVDQALSCGKSLKEIGQLLIDLEKGLVMASLIQEALVEHTKKGLWG